MSKLIDELNNRYGNLLVIAKSPSTKHAKTWWICECSCGQFCEIISWRLRSGKTQSCGCLRAQVHSKRLTTHGKSKHPLYRLYCSIKERCYSSTTKSYQRYGKRGVKVCDRWLMGENNKHGFECFLEDMGPKPYAGYSIDRIDTYGDYSPENTRWADPLTQSNNKSSNIRLTFQDETLTLGEWSRKLKIDRRCLRERIKFGWSVEEILTIPSLTNETRGLYGKGSSKTKT